jgi:hypothetical protein
MGSNNRVKTHENLEVYQIAFEMAMKIFAEKYSLSDQI